jgi:hypothetical protein
MADLTSRAHRGEYTLQAPFVTATYPADAVPYRERDGKLHCAFCGSLHPSEVVKLLDAGAKLHLADWKYGWPHKAYLDNPWGKFYTKHLVDATPEDRDRIEQALGLHIDFNPDLMAVSWRPYVGRS